jgi:hypothetical protein|tara:strand:+ start:222 stop:443 length:222 start_codon:yes stop_codon:yes gene_type:complete
MEGWDVDKDRIYTVWKEEDLKVAQKQPKRAQLWFADGSWVRHRPEHPNHVWSCDFVVKRTHDGRPLKIFNIID